MEAETKLFEDLEFQQLEQESRREEERELLSQQLLRSQAESRHSLAHRKVSCCLHHSPAPRRVRSACSASFHLPTTGTCGCPGESGQAAAAAGCSGGRPVA